MLSGSAMSMTMFMLMYHNSFAIYSNMIHTSLTTLGNGQKWFVTIQHLLKSVAKTFKLSVTHYDAISSLRSCRIQKLNHVSIDVL